jgi:hypothetical protein
VRKRRIKAPDGNEIEVVELTFQNVREHWNEYLLDDGTILKLKPVATEVFRVPDKFDQDGNPMYIIRSRNVLVVNAQEQARRPPAEG